MGFEARRKVWKAIESEFERRGVPCETDGEGECFKIENAEMYINVEGATLYLDGEEVYWFDIENGDDEVIDWDGYMRVLYIVLF